MFTCNFIDVIICLISITRFRDVTLSAFIALPNCCHVRYDAVFQILSILETPILVEEQPAMTVTNH